MSDINTNNSSKILLLLFFGVFMGSLDIAIIGPALPEISNTFHIDDRKLSWVFAVYILFNLIGTPVMAKLSDMYGRKQIYILDVFLFGLGSILCAMANDFNTLIIARAIQGFGVGGIFPVAAAVIGDVFPPEKRGGALGMIGMVFGLAFIIGPIIGGIVLKFATWNWLFYINIPIAVILILSSLKLLPGKRSIDTGKFDIAGTFFITVFLVLISFGINQIDSNIFFKSIFSSEVLPYLLFSFISLIIFIIVEKKAENPLISKNLFTTKQVRITLLIGVGAGFVEASLVFVPKLLVYTFGLNSSKASFMLIPLVAATTFAAPFSGKMLNRYGSKIIISFGIFITTAGMYILSLNNISMPLYYIGAVLTGFGLGSIIGAPLRFIMINESIESERASNQAGLSLFQGMGRLLSGALIGGIAGSFSGVSGYRNSFVFIAFIMLLLLLFSLGLKSRKDEGV